MAESKCVKCESTQFELVIKDGIAGSNFKFNFIQCAGCGAVVGAVDYYNVGSILGKICKRLGIEI